MPYVYDGYDPDVFFLSSTPARIAAPVGDCCCYSLEGTLIILATCTLLLLMFWVGIVRA